VSRLVDEALDRQRDGPARVRLELDRVADRHSQAALERHAEEHAVGRQLERRAVGADEAVHGGRRLEADERGGVAIRAANDRAGQLYLRFGGRDVRTGQG
jgi:hypothetical protein